MPARLPGRLDRLILPICLALTVSCGVVALGAGSLGARPLFFLLVGLTASLAVAELRSARHGAIAHRDTAAVELLVTTGRVPADSEFVTLVCRDGTLIVVRDGNTVRAARYFVDRAGAVHSLPTCCESARRFLERYPTAAARQPFVIRPEDAQ